MDQINNITLYAIKVKTAVSVHTALLPEVGNLAAAALVHRTPAEIQTASAVVAVLVVVTVVVAVIGDVDSGAPERARSIGRPWRRRRSCHHAARLSGYRHSQPYYQHPWYNLLVNKKLSGKHFKRNIGNARSSP